MMISVTWGQKILRSKTIIETEGQKAKTHDGTLIAHNFKTPDIMKRIFNFQSPFYKNNSNNSNNSKNKQPLRRLLSPQPSFADESLYYNEDIMIFPATSLLPTKQDLAPKPLVRTKSCDSFSTITTAEDAPGESCGIKKVPMRLSSSVLANALLPLEISFPNKPLPPMPRQLMEKARPIPEPQLDEHYFEDDDDDDDNQMEKAHRISEPELEEEEHHFEEEDDDSDDQVEIVILPDEKAHHISEPEPEEEKHYFEEEEDDDDDDDDDDQVDIEISFPTSLFQQLMKARQDDTISLFLQ
jgi:hypothetical protein